MSILLATHRSTIALFVALAVSLLSVPVQAQNTGTITGTVSDAQANETLPGANVSIVGTQRGTATNANGAYTISDVEPGSYSLRASFVGFQAQVVEQVEVAAGEEVEVNFQLQTSEQTLEEVVVVGYGEQQQRDVTGSINTVNAENFNPRTTSPEQLISGKVSGVQISSTNGAPGSDSFIRIRGPSSVNAGSDPLFVVDGVPINNEGNEATRNPLNFLNPADIADVTVLKDASATAIYGSRGANGVIMIETKSAEEGDEGRISYSGSFSTSRVTDNVDVLGVDQFLGVVQDQAPGQMSKLGDARTDWQDAVQRDAFTQEHSLSFSRGYDDSNIRLSVSWLDQQGSLESSTTERVSASLKYSQDLLDDQLTIRTNLRGSRNNNRFQPGIVGAAADFAPTQPVRDVNSPYGGFFEWEPSLAPKNPVATASLVQSVGETNRSLGNLEADLNIPYVQGLSLRAKVGYDIQEGEQEEFQPTFLKAQADNDEDAGFVARRNFSRLNTLFDAFLEYDRTFDDLNSTFDATGGYSWQEFHEEFPEFDAAGLDSDALGRNSTSPNTDKQNLNTFIEETPSRLVSAFGRFNYTLLDRYLLTFTVRRDGSSRFGPENEWGTFPSVALAWRASEEPFLSDAGILTDLKLRASWGQTGNQDIDDFLFDPLFRQGNSSVQYPFGEENLPTLRPDAANATIKWETVTTRNVGVDYGFLDGRISGSFEYYEKETEDLLFPVTVPRGANLSDVVVDNVGSVENTGFEFSVDAQVINTDDFSYRSQFNVSTLDNEVTEVTRGSNEFVPAQGIQGGFGDVVQIVREGESINSFLVFQHKTDENGDPLTDGIDHNGDGNTDRADFYKDINGDGEITQEDRVIDGSPQPDWILGHTSNLTYRDFDLSFTLRAHVGNEVYNNTASFRGHLGRLEGTTPNNLHESYLTTEFDDAKLFSDYYVEDASFLRVQNITLGYTIRSLPQVDRLRIYGTVDNAFTFTGYSGPDPEVPDGLDSNLYPRSRTFTAGINLQL